MGPNYLTVCQQKSETYQNAQLMSLRQSWTLFSPKCQMNLRLVDILQAPVTSLVEIHPTQLLTRSEMLITLDHVSSLSPDISTMFFLRSIQKDREASLVVRLAILPTKSP